MIALIIVSHCHDIAEGVCRLAGEMTQTPVPIAGVGGIVDENGQRQIGTDATAVLEAIESCWRPAGVLILVDLGSAILSAETALELLPDEQRERCLISNAPLVEGAVVAALEASLGHSLEDVNRAAEAVRNLDKVLR
ncbi:MAG: dihydroxyacetone kinase phosphoryl donor subunit DhaM [Chloroflexota bacterium]|nr:dihydroxyacetone kinase phosphoryl donor subunit DhaM [Chloroflexota bacterium]